MSARLADLPVSKLPAARRAIPHRRAVNSRPKDINLKNKLIAKRKRRIQSAWKKKKDRPNRIRTQWTKYNRQKSKGNRQKSKDNRQKAKDREVWHSFCYFITDRPTDCKTAKAVRPSQSDCRTANAVRYNKNTIQNYASRY